MREAGPAKVDLLPLALILFTLCQICSVLRDHFPGTPQMARTVAELPKGSRVTDYISLGLVAQSFSLATVESVLAS